MDSFSNKIYRSCITYYKMKNVDVNLSTTYQSFKIFEILVECSMCNLIKTPKEFYNDILEQRI